MSYFLSALQDNPHVIYQSRHIHDSVITFHQQEWPFRDASSSAYLDLVHGFQFKLRSQGEPESLPFQRVFKPRFANLTNTMKALAESLRYGPEQHSRALAAFDKPNILLGFINMRKLDPIPSDWPWISQLRTTLQLGYISKLAQVHTNVLMSESQRLRGILLLIDDLKRQKRECETDLKNIVSLGPPPANWESAPSERAGHHEYRILHHGYVIWWHELMPFMQEKIRAWSRFSRKPSRRGPAIFGKGPRLMLRDLVMLGDERRSVDKWELWEKKTMIAWSSIESVRTIVKGQLDNVDKGLDVLKGVRSGLDWRLDKRLGNKCRDC
ncbi:hypothetical protein ACEPPN_012271 [Leptodophora sp. 'Broadleaf-Isolate-01']